MARARNIKPAFFDNDQLAENDPLGRLLFIGLWTLADYQGNVEWRGKRIKAQLLPYDNADVDALAINLDKSGFVRFYSDGDKLYLNIENFSRHQNPHKNEREKGSLIPDYSEEMRQAVDLQGLTINRDKSGLKRNNSDSDRADSLIPYPDSPILKPEPLIKPLSPKADDTVNRIFNYWLSVMNKTAASKLTPKRRTCINARLKEGYTETQILQAIDGCARSSHHMGKNDQGTVYDCLTLICRSGDKLEWFINNIGTVKTTADTREQEVDDWVNGGTTDNYSGGETFNHG